MRDRVHDVYARGFRAHVGEYHDADNSRSTGRAADRLPISLAVVELEVADGVPLGTAPGHFIPAHRVAS
jgi:regulator of sirC expression with transglutaminase-like and TPR domain